MSNRELKRFNVMVEIEKKELRIKDAANLLELSRKQVSRIYKKYKKLGAQGLIHQLVNRPSNHRYDSSKEAEIIKLAQKKYFDFGPTLMSEHLKAEESISINKETLRLILKRHGLITQQRKRNPYRSKRDRKSEFGKMLQIDGSFHKWFNGEKNCLLNLIDDATGTNMGLFDREETSESAIKLLWKWILTYGIPSSIYCDRRNAYISKDHPIQSSRFGRMCEKLGIVLIPANSPQAKGRVERSNGIHQDRLIKKMRLLGIKTIEEANEYLEKSYFKEHNRKFVIKESVPNCHKELGNITLNDVCIEETVRKVNNDRTISYKGQIYQLERYSSNTPPAKRHVIINEYLDGKIKIKYLGHLVKFHIYIGVARATTLTTVCA